MTTKKNEVTSDEVTGKIAEQTGQIAAAEQATEVTDNGGAYVSVPRNVYVQLLADQETLKRSK